MLHVYLYCFLSAYSGKSTWPYNVDYSQTVRGQSLPLLRPDGKQYDHRGMGEGQSGDTCQARQNTGGMSQSSVTESNKTNVVR